MNILDQLNESQRAAVEYMKGPHMVVAGAGSGKTRVLTFKVAHLINSGIDPFNILALTFTNKAAREMKERIMGLLTSANARYVWMGTFHSIFARVLRMEAEKLGYTNSFTIYDTDDSKSLLKSIVKEFQLDDKIYKVNFVLSRISSAKTNLVNHIEYNNNQELLQQDTYAKRPDMGRIYTSYQERLRRANAMDFDDLLFNMNVLLRDFPAVLNKYQQQFKYILVDEYQDTNYAQYLIVKKLAAKYENLCVVGDDAQSIYAFRGANIQNFLQLKKEYPDLKMFKLEQNYRSSQNIVNLANGIIENNKDQIKKKVWTSNDEGEKIALHSCESENDEGNFVARSVFDLRSRHHIQENEIAVLYRTNAQSRAIEEALRRLNIPYKIFGGLSFYKRKEVKDVLAYLSLVVNPRDEASLKRVINLPKRGIGDTSLDKIQQLANQSKRSMWDVMLNIGFENILPSSAAARIMNFVELIEGFRINLETKNAYDLALQVVQTSGLRGEMLSEIADEEGKMRYENFEELLNSVSNFVTEESDEENAEVFRSLPLFMQDIALYTDADDTDKLEGNYVSLMTIHAAKGLEYSVVFIVGLEENLFPSMMALNTREELEEERRLFYVAVTRGKSRVFLSYASSRMKWGNFNFCEPSQFIAELNPEYIDDNTSRSLLGGQPKTQKLPLSSQKTFSPTAKPLPPQVGGRKLRKLEDIPANTGVKTDFAAIQAGLNVVHDRFGQGKVISVEGQGENKKAVVFFTNFGEKTLLLRFAKLQILN